MDVVKYISL